MHVLFVHEAFPAQFAHAVRHLSGSPGHRCTFLSAGDSLWARPVPGVERVHFDVPDRVASDYLTQDVAYEVACAEAAYRALRSRDLHPDLVVGHAGFGSTLFLRELYPDTPVLDYFEYFHHPHGSAADFRPDFPPAGRTRRRHIVQNAGILMHLEQCTAGYTPTHFQHGLLPTAYQPKVEVVHDGVDTAFWRPALERAAGGTRVVTYVSRGLEAMRGFDVFMRVARRIHRHAPDVVFLVVGSDSVEYGADLEHTGGRTFREHVLAGDDYDLERIRFLGPVAPDELVQILALSDLHIYLTVPFVLSWSLLNAMACGCVVLASDTAPVREVISHRSNGLLGDFFDVEGLAQQALAVLEDPAAYRPLGRAAADTINQRYSLEVVLPRLLDLFERVASAPA